MGFDTIEINLVLEKNANYFTDAKKKSRKKQVETDPAGKKKAEEEVRKRILEKNTNYYTEAMKKTRKKQAETNSTSKRRAEKEVKMRMLEKNTNYYKEAKKKSRKKQADTDPIAKKRAEEEIKGRMLDRNANYYKEAMEKTREKQKGNIDEKERRRRYNPNTVFGPIFTCSCCERELFQNSVTMITSNFREKVNQKRNNFFS